MIGRNIGPFQIVEKLGEGGLGTVYRAVDQAAQRDAAIEILRPEFSQNADLNSRLRSESTAVSRLVHPAIAKCHGFYRDGEDGFLLTEFVPGETLEDRLQRVGGLPWQQASDLVLQSLDGLKQAHDASIVHGDLKPANILITPEGRVKLKGFGIARMINEVSPEYLAPECVLGKPADGRSDLYSLGLVFYRMLTGRMAFQGENTAALLRAHVEEAPKLPSELGVQMPQPVEQALMRALAKNPDYRHADAAAFAAQLRGAVVGSAGMAQAPAVAAPLPVREAPPAAPPASAPAPASLPVAAGAPAFVPPSAAAASSVPKRPQPASQAPVGQKGGSKKGLWIALAGAVVLIGGSAGGYFALKDRWKAQPKPVAQSEPAPQAASTPAPAPVPTAETPPPPPPEPAPTSPVPPTTETPSSAATPVNRAAVLAALEQTDGPVPVGAVAGSRPLHYAGILKATRIAGSSQIINEAVQKRGVNFQLSTKQRFDLRAAGAQDPLILMLPAAYRGESAVASAARPSPTTAPEPGPPPAPPPSNSPSPAPAPAASSASAPPTAPVGPPLQHLREIHKIAVLSKEPVLDEDLKQTIKAELGSRVEVVRSTALADAVLRIEIVEDQAGKVGRAFGVKNKHKATAEVVEKRQGRVLWTTEAGDRQDMSGEGARRIALRIAKQLRKDWEK